MICFRISIFEPLKTTRQFHLMRNIKLWFAFELVSLNHWKQLRLHPYRACQVVICFRISIFEPLKTTATGHILQNVPLWFAFELVSLNHWKQLSSNLHDQLLVVICFRISIFEPLKTTHAENATNAGKLWFAFELVSLNHWKQRDSAPLIYTPVVICFRISIFEPLKTTEWK